MYNRLEGNQSSHDMLETDETPSKVLYCRAVLNPHDFDNYKFWKMIAAQGLMDEMLRQVESLEFNEFLPDAVLSRENNTDYLACWPRSFEIFFNV